MEEEGKSKRLGEGGAIFGKDSEGLRVGKERERERERVPSPPPKKKAKRKKEDINVAGG